MANDARFKQQIANAIAKNRIRILSGSSTTYHSASFLTAQSGAVTQFHSPILIPVASASAMPTPQAGTGSLYVKGTDNKIYFQDDAGTEYNLTSGGGGGSPGGSDTQLQYNNGGSFGGVASMTFDDSSGHLTIIDDKKLQFGTGNDASIEYDEDGNDVLAIDGAATKFTVAGVEIENSATAGAAALTIDNDDVDQLALDIDAANTTANVIDIQADALTTGGILNLVSDSSDTSARTLVTVKNDNTAATSTVVMHLINDAIGGLDDPILLIESTSDETHPVLELRNSNASTTSEPILIFTNPDDTAEADDMKLGQIQFKGVDSGNNAAFYAQIKADATDITSGDEGGEIKFVVMAGGTAGTAAVTELLTIGGEDVANGTNCAVIVNEAGINCDFRVESDAEDEAIFLDASAETLYINKGESDFVTQIHSTNDVAITVNSSGIIFNEDGHATNDFRVETDNNNTMFFVEASTDTVSVGGKSGHHDADFAVFNDYHDTTFENKIGSGNYGSGEVLKISTATTSLTEGQIFYLRSAGNWVAADADATSAEAQKNLLGVGLGSDAQARGVLLRGFIRVPSTEILNTPANVGGLPLFLSTTAGHFDFTAPSSSGDFVRIVGYAIDEHSGDILVYFNPDSTFVEIA